MSKILVVVESPGKIKKLQQYLGDRYLVMASVGHIRDLIGPKDTPPARYAGEPWIKLGVNVNDKFRPVYIVPEAKAHVVAKLRSAAASASHILLASDDDREGEAISWHLKEVMNIKDKSQYDRLVFHEITQPAIQAALSNLRDIDFPMVAAQESRRVIDRLYGFGMSPLLWDAVGSGTSAGRVQSPTLGILAETEIRRLEFAANDYWRLNVTIGTPEFVVQAVSYNNQRLTGARSFGEDGKINDGSRLLTKQEIEKLIVYVKSQVAVVGKVTTKAYQTSPPPPFTTSTLQQAASARLKINPKATMELAQKLYEAGLITYMRTDSPSLSAEATSAARAEATREFGQDAVPDEPRAYGAKSANAQEAHEAVRPSGTSFKTPAQTGTAGQELDLYTLIYRRTVASQMQNLRGESTEAEFKAGAVGLATAGRVVLYPGFTLMYPQDKSALDAQNLPSLAEGDRLDIHGAKAEEKKTPAPKRFDEATIISAMERQGIGRPSTYAATIATLDKRGFTVVHKQQLHVTLLGMMTHLYLKAQMPDLVGSAFTARMEADLDKISQGALTRVDYLTDIWGGIIEPAIQASTRASPVFALKRCPGVQLEIRPGKRRGEDITVWLTTNTARVSLPLNTLPELLTPDAVQQALNNGTWIQAANTSRRRAGAESGQEAQTPPRKRQNTTRKKAAGSGSKPRKTARAG